MQGIVRKKDPTYIELKVGLITYAVNVSLFCASCLEMDKECELLITQLIKEDSNKLYGFLDASEQQVFNSLLKISGVGASTAMAVCSCLQPNDFFKALGENNLRAFTAVPGIGLKGAKRIIAELGDEKLRFACESDDTAQARQALRSLGFKDEKISKVLKGVSGSVSEMIKQALKKLS